MRYSLDSSVIIDILRGDRSLAATLDKLLEQDAHFCITPIVLAELFKGAYLAKQQKDALKLVEDFTHSVELLHFTEEAAKEFGKQYAELRKKGQQTQDADLMIGCVSLVHNTILLTRNEKDFANIKGLNIEVH